MTSHPLILRAWEVLAYLAGRKTMLRLPAWRMPGKAGRRAKRLSHWPSGMWPSHAQNWQAGDRLYVQETWQTAFSDNGPCVLYRADNDRWYPEFTGPDEGAGPSYDYDRYPGDYSNWAADVETRGPWRAPSHMPRWASRLTLQILATRIEKLQEISEEDAVREGLINNGDHTWPLWTAGDGFKERLEFPRDAFREVWEHDHGPGSWDTNPEVVALSVKVHHRNIDAATPQRE